MSGLVMFVTDLFQNLFWITLFTSIAACLRYGDRPERIGISIMFIGSAMSAFATSSIDSRFQQVEVGIWVTDLIVLFAFGFMALTSKRFWPLWVTSFQLTAVTTHLADYLMPQTHASAYSIMQGFFFYPMVMAILLGCYGYQKSREPT
jgi:hypothetical protein